MKFSISKRVNEGYLIPAWYGVAWKEWQSNQAICYPIGLNCLVAVLRAFYYTVKFAGHSMPMNPRDAYAQGRRDALRPTIETT